MILANECRMAAGMLSRSWREFFARQSPQVERQQIEMACQAALRNLSAGIVAVLLILAGLLVIPPRGLNRDMLPAMAGWALAQVGVLGRGLYLSLDAGRRPMDDAAMIRQGRKLAGNGALAGALWGGASWLILPGGDLYQATFLTCAIGLVIMGGAGAQAQYGRLVASFVVSATAMFVCGILANPLLHPLLAAGMALYAAVALGFAQQQQAAIKTIIELHLENRRLLPQARESMQALEQARAAAEQANRAKTRLLAATGHDLRQPMHALALYLAHLRHCRDPREFADTLDQCDAAGKAMKDLLDAVLDLSRISLGAIEPVPRGVPLDEILQRLRGQLRPQAGLKGIGLRIEPYGGHVHTDPVLLERILCNILSNAIRYTRAGRVLVRTRLRAGWVTVRIADSGIGIARAERQRVFEEFYQVDNPERDRHKGLGLGLAIVAQLGALLGHPVSLRSRVGRGTVFRVAMRPAPAPAFMAAAAARDTGAATAAAAADFVADFVAGCAVLVVDDDPLVLDSMRRTLQDMGCHVATAGGGREALDRLGAAARVPDLIVSDYRLKGGETGLDVIRGLRACMAGGDDAMPPVPALVISGDTSPEEMAAVLRAGLAMLHKPLAPQALHARMNALLAAHSARLCVPARRET